MTNDRFLDELAASLRPVETRRPRRELLLLATVGLVELGLFLAAGQARQDFLLAAQTLPLLWKLGSLAVLASVAIVIVIRSLDPTRPARRSLPVLGLLAGLVLLSGWILNLLQGNDASLWSRLVWRHGLDCVAHIVVLSIPFLIALALLMRRGAPVDGPGSALAAGAAGAAWGAFVFAFRCPHDDPFYIAVWYVTGCSIVLFAARLILPRLSRW